MDFENLTFYFLNETVLLQRNIFIPTDFSLLSRDAFGGAPTILHQDNLGRVWFKQDQEFLLPKNFVTFNMRSPLAYFDPHHSNMSWMFVSLFNDEMKE